MDKDLEELRSNLVALQAEVLGLHKALGAVLSSYCAELPPDRFARALEEAARPDVIAGPGAPAEMRAAIEVRSVQVQRLLTDLVRAVEQVRKAQ